MSGLVLAFDTATEACAIGLGVREGLQVAAVAARDFYAPRAAMSGLLPAVRGLLDEAGVSIRDVDEVVVGRGPGSFTGVRIGVATAKGVAHGLGTPLFGVGTLDAVAWRFAGRYEGLLGVVGDAMRGEVYPALFDVGTDADGRAFVQRHNDDCVAKPGVVAEQWAAEIGCAVLLAGNGLAKYQDVFATALGERAGLSDRDVWAPSGAGLLAAYAAALRARDAGDGEPGAVLPVYTRLSDAEEAERARRGFADVTLPATGVRGPDDRTDASGADRGREPS